MRQGSKRFITGTKGEAAAGGSFTYNGIATQPSDADIVIRGANVPPAALTSVGMAAREVPLGCVIVIALPAALSKALDQVCAVVGQE